MPIYVNKIQLIRYCNLKSVDVEFGDSLMEGDPIGQADDYVRIEYCSTAKKNSKWKVIVNNKFRIESDDYVYDIYYHICSAIGSRTYLLPHCG